VPHALEGYQIRSTGLGVVNASGSGEKIVTEAVGGR